MVEQGAWEARPKEVEEERGGFLVSSRPESEHWRPLERGGRQPFSDTLASSVLPGKQRGSKKQPTVSLQTKPKLIPPTAFKTQR